MRMTCRVQEAGRTRVITFDVMTAEEMDRRDRKIELALDPKAWSPRAHHGKSLDTVNQAMGIRVRRPF